MKKTLCHTLWVLLLSTQLQAAPEKLLQTQQSWDGGDFSYPKGQPEITSVKLTLKEGKDTPFHCHPIPTLGYIAKGEVLLETEAGLTTQYAQGASVVEAMRTLHRGKALSEEAEIIVFYAGAENIPVTVFPEDKENFKKYCQ